ncbi:nucleotidyltransferase family protein [Sphingomonas sp. 37zxx]|uniref:nucleotidyltransferase family protein n=1 Tax=Sphingomonas sp. 37zxx TaxID=1550073 RepID=UPI00053BE2AB|nr:nucleotidyltransferase family protein [Sphingomonas sp. 37zxx]
MAMPRDMPGSAMLAAETAEFALVRACIASPIGMQGDIIRRLAETADPGRLVAIAGRHGVTGLVAEALSIAGAAVPPRLALIARKRGFAALRQADTALALQAALRQAGVAVLTLKGTALAQLLYGRIGIRESVDIDLVVAPACVVQSWQVLAMMGFDQVTPRCRRDGSIPPLYLWAAKDSIHRHRDTGMLVELHWRLSDDLACDALPPPAAWQAVAIDRGRALMTLRDEDLFVYLCTHGAAHGWARLKWLADIAAMTAATADGGARYWQVAQAAGSERAAASALLLANRLLGAPLPAGFAYRSRRVALLNRMAIRIMTAGGGMRELSMTPYRGWVEFTAKSLIAPHRRNILAIARRVLLSGDDIGMLALPRGLAFLYPILRVPMLMARRIRRAGQR